MDAYTAAEQAFDAACQAHTNAERAFRRSKSAKNRAAFLAASEAHETAAAAMRHEQTRMERAATVARRLELTAPRRALRAAQGSLFA